MLALKDALGLFDNPFRSLDAKAERRLTATPATKRIAREAATRSIVLLRNEGDLLPLPRAGKKLALIGPFGADQANLNGPWSFAGESRDGIDLATGIRAMLRSATDLSVEPGSGIAEPLPGGIDRAVAAVRAVDVVLLAIGEGGDMSGEGNSRADITIPAAQQALAEAVAATGKPVVVLLRHGRALALTGAIRAAPAILATWFLGEQTGPAVADILFRVREPTGRLPVSFPFSTGQQPWSYDRKSTGRPALGTNPMEPGKSHWRDAPNRALFPFGSGLGYTSFQLTGMTAPATIAADQPATVNVEVTNTGPRRGETLVELHVRDRVASRTRPVRQLKAFGRITLDAGASGQITLNIPYEDFGLVTADGTWRVEPGAFDLMAAIGGEVKLVRSVTAT